MSPARVHVTGKAISLSPRKVCVELEDRGALVERLAGWTVRTIGG
jgi:hypothetical protein